MNPGHLTDDAHDLATRYLPGAALEKVENSARQALDETSRLLNVLRDPDGEAVLRVDQTYPW